MENLPQSVSNSIQSSSNNHLSTDVTQLTQSNFASLSTFIDNKAYVPINGCIIEHILTTSYLLPNEKLYYLVSDSLSLINKNNGRDRSIALAGHSWAKLINCSKSQVFVIQRELERKGYLVVVKDKNKYGQHQRNLVIPTLPKEVFKSLCASPNRTGVEDVPYTDKEESRRDYLDKTKLFIPINYQLLKLITSDETLPPLCRVFWLYFYVMCYKNHIASKKVFDRSVICSLEQITEDHNCTKAALSRIMNILERKSFVKRNQFFVKNGSELAARHDKSLWKITICLPDDIILQVQDLKDRASHKNQCNSNDNSAVSDDADKRTAERLINDVEIEDNELDYVEDAVEELFEKNDLKTERKIVALLEKLNTELGIYSAASSGGSDSTDKSVVAEVAENKDKEATNQNQPQINVVAEQDQIISKNDNQQSTTEHMQITEYDEKTDDDYGQNEAGGSTETTGLENIKEKSAHSLTDIAQYINKSLKIKIKEFKGNLGEKAKVLFNDFLKGIKAVEGKTKTIPVFNVCSLLIRKRLKELSKDKADKARRYAYTLISKKLATGYAATLSKHELAKQFIIHITSWKPTKAGNISRAKEIDIALSVAWQKVVNGTWQVPLQYAKAEVLQHEFLSHRQKYQYSGSLSPEIKVLEREINKLTDGFCNLTAEVMSGIDTIEQVDDKDHLNHGNGDSKQIVALECQDFNSNLDKTNDEAIDVPEGCFIGEKYYDKSYFDVRQLDNDSIDLTAMAEERKCVKVTAGDTDVITIQTTDRFEYFGQLKTMDINEYGDLVMTLKTTARELFAGLTTNNGSGLDGVAIASIPMQLGVT